MEDHEYGPSHFTLPLPDHPQTEPVNTRSLSTLANTHHYKSSSAWVGFLKPKKQNREEQLLHFRTMEKNLENNWEFKVNKIHMERTKKKIYS